jgi:7-cyano-7-deazaguanine synthase
MNARDAVVLLSGGLDSGTVLAVARNEGYRCHALSVAYGQRHGAELAAAENVARHLQAVSHRVMHMDLSQIGGSALTDPDIPVPSRETEGIPVTYVPARNTLFLSLALAWAEVLKCDNIFIGVNAVDYSGYPDCRPEFVRAFEQMANLATCRAVEGHTMKIHAPLVAMNKADIIRLGMELNVDYGMTVSCYQADATGAACGECDACRYRREGFERAGIPDPTRYR